jgi:hypothetical protein
MTGLRGLCSLAVLVSFSALAADSPFDPPSPIRTCSKKLTDLKHFIAVRYADGVPFSEARDFRSCEWAVSTLEDTLRHPEEPAAAENAVVVLGIVGKPQTAAFLRTYLESREVPQEETVSYAAYLAKMNVPAALGCLLNQFNLDIHRSERESGVESVDALREARVQTLKYLTEGLLDPGKWSGRLKWKSTYDRKDFDLFFYLAEKSAQGLALAGDSDAECVMQALKDHVDGKSQPEALKEAPGRCGIGGIIQGHSWSRSQLASGDKLQLSRVLRDALVASAKVRSCSDGLLGYYSRP